MIRKALISLEFLVGLILSMTALVVVVDAFYTNYFNDLSNLEVAELNAQKIVDFVNYGFVNSDYSDCFFMFKTFDRQFFQDENQRKYFYVLKDDFLYVFEDSLLDSFKQTNFDVEGFGYDDNAVLSYKLNGKVNVKRDLTRDGNVLASLDLFMTNTLFGVGDSSDLILGETQGDFLLILDDSDRFSFFVFLKKFKGSGKVSVASVRELERLSSSFLIFQEGDLFVSDSDLTSLIARTNLCVGVMSSVDAMKSYYRSHLEELDFYNFRVVVRSRDVSDNRVFVWDPRDVDFCSGSLVFCEGDSVKDKFDFFFRAVSESLKDNLEIVEIVEISELAHINSDNFEVDDILVEMGEQRYSKLKLKSQISKKVGNSQVYYDAVFDYYILIVDDKAYFTQKENVVLKGLARDYFYDLSDAKDFSVVDEKFLRVSDGDRVSVGNNVVGTLSSVEVDDVNYDGLKPDNVELYCFVGLIGDKVDKFYLTKSQFNKILAKRS